MTKVANAILLPQFGITNVIVGSLLLHVCVVAEFL